MDDAVPPVLERAGIRGNHAGVGGSGLRAVDPVVELLVHSTHDQREAGVGAVDDGVRKDRPGPLGPPDRGMDVVAIFIGKPPLLREMNAPDGCLHAAVLLEGRRKLLHRAVDRGI